ncbi:MAG: BspA family leucine-rich repeat surface protein, partial [Salinispira sp.]
WNVGKVVNMISMFQNTNAFNGDISGWDVSSVTNMLAMFKDAVAFAQDLEDWKDHWTLNANGKYTGTDTGIFNGSGVTGDLIPTWY